MPQDPPRSGGKSNWLEPPLSRTILLALIAGLVILGFFLADDYGQSWDEYMNANIGALNLRAYTDPGALGEHRLQTYYHGPAYFMLVSTFSEFTSSIIPGWTTTDGRHFLTYLIFLLGVWSVFDLARRLISRPAALFSAALLYCQPLLFGHAFINLKDIPFFALFSLSVALGFRAVDSMATFGGKAAAAESDGRRTSRRRQMARGLREDWDTKSPRLRAGYLALLIATLLLLADLTLAHRLFSMLQSTLASAYRGESLGFINAAFRRVAVNAAELGLDPYLSKLEIWYRRAQWSLSMALLVSHALLFRGLFPRAWEHLVSERLRAGTKIGLAGIVLGLALSTRTAAPFAGLLVSALALRRYRGRAIPPLLAYWGLAFGAAYATWPALWDNPVSGLWDRMIATVQFEEHQVLYAGSELWSDELPWHYLPVLLGIQLTEPVFPMTALGVYALVLSSDRRGIWYTELALHTAWFLSPLVAVLILRPSLYNNFRQVLFITPPLFILAGLGLQWLADSWTERAWLPVALIALTPGFLGLIRLHPYQYLYYNQLVGGVRGAQGTYELDYWCTSFRSAVRELNSVAPRGATVSVWGPLEAARAFARADLLLEHYDGDEPGKPAYGLACDQAIGDPNLFVGYETIERITHLGLPLAEVKVRR